MVGMRWELGPWEKQWTGPAARRSSQFKADWPATLALLAEETGRLDAGLVVIEIDVPCEALNRNRQALLAGRAPAHPGVRVHFESRHGELNYATAEFWAWRDNVRAVARSLEALRLVDRYGVSHGTQYVGFRSALPAGGSAPEFDSPREAAGWLAHTGTRLHVEPGSPAELARRLSRVLHPDGIADQSAVDPDGSLWATLQAARTILTKAGVL